MYTLKDGSSVSFVPDGYTGLSKGLDSQIWYLRGKAHKTNGPASVHADGLNFWYYQDYWHCTEGPAVSWADNDKDWYAHGKYINPKTKVVLVCTR